MRLRIEVGEAVRRFAIDVVRYSAASPLVMVKRRKVENVPKVFLLWVTRLAGWLICGGSFIWAGFLLTRRSTAIRPESDSLNYEPLSIDADLCVKKSLGPARRS